MQTHKVSHATNFEKDIPVLGFGAMGISEFYGITNEDLATKTVQLALKNGITHFDTADCYSFGDNEVFLNKSLNLTDLEVRSKLIIASKAGIVRDRNDVTVRGINIEPKYLKNQLSRSLNNLGTDYLDIFYIHRLPPESTEYQLEILAEFLQSIKNDGLAKSIGLSEPTLEQLKKIHSICPISFLQSEYSLLERGMEQNGILDFCRANSIIFVAYSPLCRGLLTDGFDPQSLDQSDFRKSLPKFTGENYETNSNIITQLKIFANERNVSLSTLALAWLIAQNVIAIPGMRKTERVNEALPALDFKLSKEDLGILNSIAYVGATKGMRYSPAAMQAYGFK